MKKRFLASILAICLFFTGANYNIFLAEEKDAASGNLITESDSDVNILTQKAFDSVFTQNTRALDESAIENISYTYSFQLCEDNVLSSDVHLWITMLVNEVEYPIELVGTVDACELSNGSILWMGPIRGIITIEGVEYLAIAAFVKLEEKLQMSLTIQGTSSENAIDPIVITFGDDVLTEEVYNELEEKTETVDNNVISATAERYASFTGQRASNGFTTTSNIPVRFTNSNVSGYGQRMKGYYDDDSRRIAISITSYCSNVDNYYNTLGFASTGVDEFVIELERGNNAYSYIAGMERFNFSLNKFGILTYIEGLFSDAMTLLDVSFPTETISALLSGVEGVITKEIDSNIATVTVELGALDYANFDNSGPGLPIIFQLQRSNSSYTGTHNYILRTSITYRTYLQQTYPASTILVYTNAYDAEDSINISLNN